MGSPCEIHGRDASQRANTATLATSASPDAAKVRGAKATAKAAATAANSQAGQSRS